MTTHDAAPAPAKIPAARPRLASLDALRGFNMFWLIGGQALVLRATAWLDGENRVIPGALSHGAFGEAVRPWDLVMPLFLFMSGVAMAFSGPWAPSGAKPDAKRWLKVGRRVLILWILGMAIQGNLLSYRPEKMIFFSNTLQAIAVGGLIAELVACCSRMSWRIVLTLALPVASFLITWGAGGGYEKGTNVALRWDDAIQGVARGDREYAWILPCLNFGFTTLIGAFAGRWLRSGHGIARTAFGLAFAGVLALVAAKALAPLEPVNKHLWTGTFALWSGGWCLLLLAGFHAVIDGWKLEKTTFALRVVGVNALAAYLLGNLVNLSPVSAVFTRGFRGLVSAPAYETIAAGGHVILIWLILFFLWKKKAYLKF